MAIRLSKRAVADLQEIRAYTIDNWGREQWLIYYRRIVAAFERIAAKPEIGKDRSLFASGMRSIDCEKHIIFYRQLKATGGKPVVLHIVHQSRNLPALIYYEHLDLA